MVVSVLFAIQRGRTAYNANSHDFAKLIWKNVSPKWDFSNAAFERTAAAFNSPDHVDIVIHNCRRRLSLLRASPNTTISKRNSTKLQLSLPAITIASDFDGATADGAAYRNEFSGNHVLGILRGIGHNVPQEAPQAFAQPVVDVSGLES
jgi:pimeloyl-ACP methyl ester carboxylesterase